MLSVICWTLRFAGVGVWCSEPGAFEVVWDRCNQQARGISGGIFLFPSPLIKTSVPDIVVAVRPDASYRYVLRNVQDANLRHVRRGQVLYHPVQKCKEHLFFLLISKWFLNFGTEYVMASRVWQVAQYLWAFSTFSALERASADGALIARSNFVRSSKMQHYSYVRVVLPFQVELQSKTGSLPVVLLLAALVFVILPYS